jgi:hypothetical protein
MDLPSDDEGEDASAALGRRAAVLFDAQAPGAERDHAWDDAPGWQSEMPRAAQAVRDRDEEDVWAELG